ncbi:MAG: tRNA pseudouridine(55) synthase TruB, partial [Acidobacteriota bacterium]|nr:tRNA pseudouridine(55) synthase TruB [Acidobacteriota bacterium]
ELARAGEEVERKPVPVSIHKFEAIKPTDDLLKDNLDGTYDLEVRVECSSGTYVRTLAEDFGKQLQVGAHLAELRRTRVGDLDVNHAQTLEQVKVSFAEESVGTVLRKPDEALARLPAIDLNDEDVRKAEHGVDLRFDEAKWSDGERVRMRDAAGNLIAVASFNAAERSMHPMVVLAAEHS